MGSRWGGRAERNASISKGLSGRGDRSFSCLLVRVCWELCPRHPHLPIPVFAGDEEGALVLPDAPDPSKCDVLKAPSTPSLGSDTCPQMPSESPLPHRIPARWI